MRLVVFYSNGFVAVDLKQRVHGQLHTTFFISLSILKLSQTQFVEFAVVREGTVMERSELPLESEVARLHLVFVHPYVFGYVEDATTTRLVGHGPLESDEVSAAVALSEGAVRLVDGGATLPAETYEPDFNKWVWARVSIYEITP